MTENKNFRDLKFEEAHKLQLQLIDAGYPAQMYYSEKKWKVEVEAIPMKEELLTSDFL